MSVETVESEGRISRRQLLRLAWGTSIAIVVAELVGVTLAFLWPHRKVSAVGSEVRGGSVEQLLAEIPVGAVPKRFRQARFYLSHVEDGLLALSQKCTHLGCAVPWSVEEDQFHCPCHSATFNRKGEVLGGPAPRPLDLFPIHIRDGEMYVDTNTVIERDRYEPSQATTIS
ncbi:MAG: ubiquinol-cytochrome c reductase iron-sulfur subunit [Anaerolineae bacterium]